MVKRMFLIGFTLSILGTHVGPAQAIDEVANNQIVDCYYEVKAGNNGPYGISDHMVSYGWTHEMMTKAECCAHAGAAYSTQTTGYLCSGY